MTCTATDHAGRSCVHPTGHRGCHESMTKAPGRRDHVGATVHARWWDRHADDLAGLAALAQVPRSPGDGVTADDALAAARARLRQTSDTRP